MYFKGKFFLEEFYWVIILRLIMRIVFGLIIYNCNYSICGV